MRHALRREHSGRAVVGAVLERKRLAADGCDGGAAGEGAVAPLGGAASEGDAGARSEHRDHDVHALSIGDHLGEGVISDDLAHEFPVDVHAHDDAASLGYGDEQSYGVAGAKGHGVRQLAPLAGAHDLGVGVHGHGAGERTHHLVDVVQLIGDADRQPALAAGVGDVRLDVDALAAAQCALTARARVEPTGATHHHVAAFRPDEAAPLAQSAAGGVARNDRCGLERAHHGRAVVRPRG